ncbi:MAG: DUF4837 family protein [Bacteroidota bacterium]
MNYIKNSVSNLSYLFQFLFFVFLGSIMLYSCASDSSASYTPALSGAMGKTSEIVVIADENVWEGTAGDTFRYYFESAYLILPQPEPVFDLRHMTPEKLYNDPIYRELRTYVIIGNLSDEQSPVSKMIKKDIGEEKLQRAKENPNFHTVIGNNKWARGQLLAFIFGDSQDQLAENIKKSYPMIAKRVHDFDQPQIGKMVYIKGRNFGIEKVIKEKFDAEMKIPQEYFVAVDEPNTMWLRKETGELSSNIFIHQVPYTSQDQFTKEGIKAIRDKLGKKHVTTEIKGAYMRTNDEYLPIFLNTMDLNGNYAVEARGIWDLVNDFMGGPFMSYLIHNKDSNQLLYVEGFVHAPSTTKRKFMEQIEHLLRQTKFGDPTDAEAVTEE